MGQPKRFTDAELRANKNARSRQRYAERRDEIAAKASAAYRLRAEDPEFRQRERERAAAYRARNPDVTRQQNHKRRQADPEKARAESRQWFAENRDKRAAYEQNRRAKKRAQAGKISPNLKQSLFIAQRGGCACCRGVFGLAELHMDHIMPLSKGGLHDDENIQLLCQPCNQAKYAKHPVDFMQERGFLC